MKSINKVNKFYNWLGINIFPKISNFYANPLMILITIFLFVPMVAWQANVVLILLLNSWMNVGSFSTSQITLRQVILTADEQEKRNIETHDTVMKELTNQNNELALLREEIQNAKEQRIEASDKMEELVKLVQSQNIQKHWFSEMREINNILWKKIENNDKK